MIIGRQMAFNNTMAEASKLQPEELHTDATAVFKLDSNMLAQWGQPSWLPSFLLGKRDQAIMLH
ncbi:hypothetical protein SDC49_21590 [Lactobacillus sp. R2/2]|nr:hypothetical protein [Lactobacillus sp. R2/2]